MHAGAKLGRQRQVGKFPIGVLDAQPFDGDRKCRRLGRLLGGRRSLFRLGLDRLHRFFLSRRLLGFGRSGRSRLDGRAAQDALDVEGLVFVDNDLGKRLDRDKFAHVHAVGAELELEAVGCQFLPAQESIPGVLLVDCQIVHGKAAGVIERRALLPLGEFKPAGG